MREKLIAYRGERSQKEMGAMFGVSQQAWCKWEMAIATPRPFLMKRIADDSGIPMEVLFADSFTAEGSGTV